MLNSGLYAVRKRRRPMQKIKPVNPEGAKSNPSKRHRARFNAELERLAGVLPFPQDVIAKLDKLSVLRLSVAYLRAKRFFEVSLQHQKTKSLPRSPSISSDSSSALRNLVEVTDVPESDFMLWSDIINQDVFELIHVEDREEFRRQLHWDFSPPLATTKGGEKSKGYSGDEEVLCPPDQLPSENSGFLNRSFQCRFRCLLDNKLGFLALHFHGKLKFLHGQKKSETETPLPTQLALFAIAIPIQPAMVMEIRTTSLFFRTKHKLDFTILSCDANDEDWGQWTDRLQTSLQR
ncbi:aryl hydrocarbon receptor-like isoform X1 [Cetorhinus maximus]